MDLLIKNMEMPKSCEECPLFYEYYSKLEGKSVLHCRARGEGESRFSDDFDWRTKPTYEEGCPLVEVPTHGRLINADALQAELEENSYPSERCWYYAEVGQFIDEAETVLEASNG